MADELTLAERALIGAAMIEPARVIPLCEGAGVESACFLDPAMGKLWAAIDAMWREKLPVDLVLVTERLRAWGQLEAIGGSATAENAVLATPTAADAEYYLQLLLEANMQRVMNRELDRFRQDLPAGAAHAAQGLINRLGEIMTAGAARGDIDRRGLLDATRRTWQMLHQKRMVEKDMAFWDGLAMPWEILNHIYSGLKPGLHILAARPSQGKTAMAVNISSFWGQIGVPHLVVSCDMPTREMQKRYICAEARLSLRKLEWGARSDEVARACETGEAMLKHPVHFTEVDDIEKLHGLVCMAKAAWGIQAVIVDYLQVMHFKGDSRLPRNDRIAQVTQHLKRIALREDIPVLALCQLNRESVYDDREPELHDLGDSGEIERAAMSCAFLWVDRMVLNYWQGRGIFARDGARLPIDLAYGFETLAPELWPVWLIVAKNQQGPTRKAPFLFYRNYFIFRPGDHQGRAQQIKPEGHKAELVNLGQFGSVRDDWRVLTPEDDYLVDHGLLGTRGYGHGKEVA